ncbi:MAG: cupin domain-containing protein [Burkholderiaceae bacterium]
MELNADFINADFTERVVVHGDQTDWKDSPMPGVRRRMFDRLGNEVARATTIVSYAPDSRFSAHTHSGGEEFLILEGVFEDEHGIYPKGSYVRNPPQTAHTPGSTPGCVMFVKLWQFDPADRTHIIQNFEMMAPVDDLHRPGVSVIPLFRDARETVRIETLSPGVRAEIDTTGGAEILVLNGLFEQGGDTFRQQSWLRIPVGGAATLTALDQGARVWIKNGHLRYVSAPGAASSTSDSQ